MTGDAVLSPSCIGVGSRASEIIESRPVKGKEQIICHFRFAICHLSFICHFDLPFVICHLFVIRPLSLVICHVTIWHLPLSLVIGICRLAWAPQC